MEFLTRHNQTHKMHYLENAMSVRRYGKLKVYSYSVCVNMQLFKCKLSVLLQAANIFGDYYGHDGYDVFSTQQCEMTA